MGEKHPFSSSLVRVFMPNSDESYSISGVIEA
jgi:hypothetical protein